MGEIVAFPIPPERPVPDNATADEVARYLALRGGGLTDDQALEVLVQARRVRGVCHAD